MKLMDLYTRVVETTGLDIITLDSLQTAVANCMADLTSRGYRTFCEKHLSDLKYKRNENLIKFEMPKDVRKNLYIRLFLNNQAVVATRYSLSNRRVACTFTNGEFRTLLSSGQAIYYTKGDTLIIEWDPYLGELQDISYGYYQRLIAPKVEDNVSDVKQLESIDFDIRPEFEDAVVLYAAYFYYARYVKDPDRIQHYQSNYKYYVEDLTHELAYEDDFNEEDAVIKCEEE